MWFVKQTDRVQVSRGGFVMVDFIIHVHEASVHSPASCKLALMGKYSDFAYWA
jgi:hypothetical protein